MKIESMLLALVLGPVLAFADTAVIGGIEWTYRVEDGNAILGGGTTATPAVPKATSGDLVIPAAIAGHPVTKIGDYAFFYCDLLTSVTFPDTVTTIGRDAFFGCDGTQNVNAIGKSAFSNCPALTSVAGLNAAALNKVKAGKAWTR